LQYAKIPTGAAVRDHDPGQVVHAPASRKLPAGLPRLAHFECRIADAVAVADADRFLAQAANCEILAKRAMRHFGHPEFLAPLWIVIGTVGENGFIDTPVMLQIGLAVALQIHKADEYGSARARFEKAGSPGEVVWVSRVFVTVAFGHADLNRCERA